MNCGKVIWRLISDMSKILSIMLRIGVSRSLEK